MDYDELVDMSDGVNITENGDYLCIQYADHPLHVYRRVPPGKKLHPSIACAEHNGTLYSLDRIEDEKEFGDASSW